MLDYNCIIGERTIAAGAGKAFSKKTSAVIFWLVYRYKLQRETSHFGKVGHKLSPMALCLVPPESWISIINTDSIFIKHFS